MGRFVKVLLLALLVLVVLLVGAFVFRRTEVQVATFAGVDAVELASDSGSISISQTRGDELLVTSKLRFVGRKPKLVQKAEGRSLRLQSECEFPLVTCGVDYSIRVPEQTAVQVILSAGEVKLIGLDGRIKVDTDAGNIYGSALGGQIHLKTSAGNISGDRLESPGVLAVSLAGNIELAFAKAPTLVDASTGAGNISLKVPDKGFRVKTRAVAGKVNVGISTDPSAEGLLSAKTPAGNISITRKESSQ
ncbi:MAG: hypothetical protein ACR2FO_04760 [Actinomycetota bacterium]